MAVMVATDEVEVAFNLAYRITGSESDAAEAVEAAFLDATQRLPRTENEQSFAHLLLAATRNACHDLMPRRRRPLPAATPPALHGSSDEAIAGASMCLPVRQREALALRELGRLSYEEIAAIMATSGNSVAQLISRARINLSDELRGTVLASVAAPSPECERALPLIAMRQDGQLEAGSREKGWLDVHLAACDRCRLGIEAMQEADTSYRAWAPVAASAGLLAATMAKAAALSGSDWSEEIIDAEAAHGSAGSGATSVPAAGSTRSPRRRPLLAAALATLLLLSGLSAIFLGDDPGAPPLDPAADAAPAPSGAGPRRDEEAKAKTKGDAAQQGKKPEGSTSAAQTSDGATTSTPDPVVTQVTTEGSSGEPASGPERPSGEAGIEPTQPTSTPAPSRKPKPVQTTGSAPQPAPEPAPAPVSEEQPAEAAESGPPGHKDPPGKAVGRPPK